MRSQQITIQTIIITRSNHSEVIMSQANLHPIPTEEHSQDDLWQQLMEDIKNPNLETEKKRNQALSSLLTEWESEDLEEQQETWNLLEKSLKENKIRI